jgi:class 3 adenylate cyclase/tetratricopeptide (TPR) repeat protein
MKCPTCQTFNRAEAKFCEECAAPLARTCADCGHQLSPSAKFCPECASPTGAAGKQQIGSSDQSTFGSPDTYTPKHLARKILNSKAALEGERKHVTVLFADLKGSMELLAERDPEEAQRLLGPVLEHMMEAVHHYEGTVNQVAGDGIMALFGAPLAHEDHAVRACYAALRMQERIRHHAEGASNTHGVNLQIRVGLNSGEVVVGTVGSDLRMDYTAIGRTTHLAARMEQMASPGSILLTQATLGMAEGFVVVKPLGPVPVKGLAEAVNVYEVTGMGPARTRLESVARRGLTRFVGRDAELERLRRVLQVAGNSHGRIVAVVAEAGVGKSRLVHELRHSDRLHGWLVLECAGVSYGKAMSYLPVINLLKDYFAISDRDDPREMRDKVTGKLLALDRALEPTLPALLALLDVPLDGPSEGSQQSAVWQALDPAERRRRTLDGVKRLLLREAREQPLLAIIEDLHWIDGETQALLDALVDSLEAARLLLLVNYRPEYQHNWANRTSYSQMQLDALPAESTAELLDALLGNDPALAPLKELLVERGNPFFLEETVRTLVETKALAGERGQYRLTQQVQAIQIPATVQAVLAARIDRLLPTDKHLLQIASVIGKDVPLALLQTIAELPEAALRGALDRLQAAEFVYETCQFPHLEYTFKHALTHEVSYGGLLQERRRGLHAQIVGALERLHADRLGEQIERLAHHAVQGDLREKAVEYLRQAGQKAAARSALSDARVWFEQALIVLERLPDTKAKLEASFETHYELRHMLFQLGEVRQGLEHLREAEALAERLNDDHRRGRVFAALMHLHAILGELDEALAAGNQALKFGTRLGDLRLRIQTLAHLVQVHCYRGEYPRAIELATVNLAELPPDGAHESFGLPAPPAVYTRFWLVPSFAQLGRFAEAAQCGADLLQLAESMQLPFAVGGAHQVIASSHTLRGDWARALPLIEKAIAMFRTRSMAIVLPGAIATSANVLAQLGEVHEALTRLQEANELLDRQVAQGKFTLLLSGAYHDLARACLVLDRLDDSRRLVDRAVEFSRGRPGAMGHALHLLGDIATHSDSSDAEIGEARYRQALALAEVRGMRPLVAHCHLGLSKLYQRVGKQEEADQHFITATTLYREMDMPLWLEQAGAKKSS